MPKITASGSRASPVAVATPSEVNGFTNGKQVGRGHTGEMTAHAGGVFHDTHGGGWLATSGTNSSGT